MMRNSTMKWVAPIVLAGVVIAGGFAAIAAAPWSNSGTADVEPDEIGDSRPVSATS